jgi:hypothetical protein
VVGHRLELAAGVFSPKGCDNLAQGNALGKPAKNIRCSLKGCDMRCQTACSGCGKHRAAVSQPFRLHGDEVL